MFIDSRSLACRTLHNLKLERPELSLGRPIEIRSNGELASFGGEGEWGGKGAKGTNAKFCWRGEQSRSLN